MDRWPERCCCGGREGVAIGHGDHIRRSELIALLGAGAVLPLTEGQPVPVTGVTSRASDLTGKQFGFLRNVSPQANQLLADEVLE